MTPPVWFQSEIKMFASESMKQPWAALNTPVDFRTGQSQLKFFAEARYHQMLTAHGRDSTYAPITFGVHW